MVISTLNANLRVATRVYDVEGGAIFSKNSTFVFFDGAAWIPRLRSPSPIMAPGDDGDDDGDDDDDDDDDGGGGGGGGGHFSNIIVPFG